MHQPLYQKLDSANDLPIKSRWLLWSELLTWNNDKEEYYHQYQKLLNELDKEGIKEEHFPYFLRKWWKHLEQTVQDRFGNFALYLVEEALNIVPTIKDWEDRSKALITCLEVISALGGEKEAHNFLERMLESLDKIHYIETRDYETLCVIRGIAHFSRKISFLEIAKGLIKNLHKKLNLCRGLLICADGFARLGQLSVWNDLVQYALEVAKKIRLHKTRAEALLAVGMEMSKHIETYEDNNWLEELQNATEQIASAYYSDYLLSSCLDYLLLRHRKEPNLIFLRRSIIPLANSLKISFSRAKALVNCSYAYMQLERNDDARELISNSWEMINQRRNSYRKGQILVKCISALEDADYKEEAHHREEEYRNMYQKSILGKRSEMQLALVELLLEEGLRKNNFQYLMRGLSFAEGITTNAHNRTKAFYISIKYLIDYALKSNAIIILREMEELISQIPESDYQAMALTECVRGYIHFNNTTYAKKLLRKTLNLLKYIDTGWQLEKILLNCLDNFIHIGGQAGLQLLEETLPIVLNIKNEYLHSKMLLAYGNGMAMCIKNAEDIAVFWNIIELVEKLKDRYALVQILIKSSYSLIKLGTNLTSEIQKLRYKEEQIIRIRERLLLDMMEREKEKDLDTD